MDLHPTSFPGELRPSANAKKEGNERKSSREPNRVITVASRHRQNRVFGTVRTSNATVEKPPREPTKALRQMKPSGPPRRLPGKKEPTGATREGAKDAAVKPESKTEKSSGVRFLDQQQPPEKALGRAVPEEGPRTPLSAVKPTMTAGTPYHSAKSCSKCRLDKLESAPYWIAQIKLAESVGKHFVSATFFRLAVECNAEPIQSLKSELKRYMVRHSSLPVLTMWKEVCRDCGLLNSELVCDFGVTPQPNSPKEGSTTMNAEAVATEANNNVNKVPPAASTGNASDDKLVYESDESNIACHCVSAESMMVSAPENKSVVEKSDGGASPVCGSSSVGKKIWLGKAVDGSETASNISQAASELCGEATGKSKEETSRYLSCQHNNAGSVDEDNIDKGNGMHDETILGSGDDQQGS